jgi:hypothetical protein
MPEGILASPPSRIMTIPPSSGFQDFESDVKP